MQGTVNLIIALVLIAIFIFVIGGLGKLSDKFQTKYIGEEKRDKFHSKALFVIVFIALCIYLFLGGIFSDYMHSLI
jgi:cadmium resistance protein CadD (predicted permease)